MARAATFDPELEARVGEAMGAECRALGGNLLAAVCVNVLRHPGWGRAQESYGEDPHLVGEMGAALVTGIQRHVMACVKHLACNSIEDGRFSLDVSIDEDDLRDIYLPAFRRCVDAGAAAVMTAYNAVNGERCGHHAHLLLDVLKGEWGFDGFVMSDFVLGVRDARAVAAGLDLEMPFAWRFRALRRRVRQGGAGRAHRRRRPPAAPPAGALRRPGRTTAAAGNAPAPGRGRARAPGAGPRVAERSMVLLRNVPVPACRHRRPAPSTAPAPRRGAPTPSPTPPAGAPA